MSDYVKLQFWCDDYNKISAVRKEAKKVFDAIHISADHKNDYWSMTISELDLKESLPILDKLKKKFNLVFVVSYGVY